MLVKICGLTTMEDASAAVETGADAIGFVFAPSPRRVTPAQAVEIGARLPPGILKVGVFVAPEPREVAVILEAAGLDLAQIHGAFPEEARRSLGARAIRGVRVGRDEPSPILALGGPRFLLLDAYHPDKEGGTGRTFAWARAAAYRGLGAPILIAGGLDPDNVRTALETARPDGVDVSSGVEHRPGRKDPEKMAAFVRAVRCWERQTHS